MGLTRLALVPAVSAVRNARPARSALLTCGLALALSLGCSKATTIGGAGGGNGSGTGASSGSGTGGIPGTGTGGGSGTGGIAGTGTGGGNGSGTGGTFTSSGTGGAVTQVDAGADANCQQASYTFAPKIPTVYVVADRSGSEFDSPTSTTGTYFTLRAAVLQVIQQLQTASAQIRFGLGLFVGTHATGQCVPDFETVPIDMDNYAAIAAKYNSLAQLQPPGAKADTPAAAVIPMVKAALLADTAGTGQKYMMFVTDSETDFCDDGNFLCAVDAVTFEIQDLYAAGIGTLVIGLPSTGAQTTAPAILQSFANAGAGLTVALPPVGGLSVPSDISSQCAGSAGSADSWAGFLAASGHTGAIATYGSPAGKATVYTPSSTSTADLATQISAAISGVKSCTFDLSNVNGKSIKVDLTQLASAHVLIQSAQIPQDATNGWSMSSQTQLLLNGTACKTWETPGNDNIDFQFPCQSIIFE
jgi:hypothetical protein